MKKVSILSKVLGLAFLSMIAVACSNDTESDGTGGAVNMAEGTTFKLTFADYNEEQEVKGTRAAKADSDSVKLDPVDLGNGIVAYPTIVKDKSAKTSKAPRTRAFDNGNYTMLAYQGGVLKGEMNGTASTSGGVTTFTPAAGSAKIIWLTPGVYDFVCYTTDYVTRSGNQLTIIPTNVDKALIGRSASVIVSGQKQEIPFTMKHVGARVRVGVESLMNFNITGAQLSSIASNVPNDAVYDASTGVYSYTQGSRSDWYGMPTPAIPAWGSSYQSLSTDYKYFMPGTDPSKLQIKLFGSFFQQPFTGGGVGGGVSSMTAAFKLQTPAGFTFQEGNSYLIRFQVKYNYIYLFSDGTTGTFTETTQGGGTKTAIGIVVSRSRRLAAALNTLPGGAYAPIRSPSYTIPGKGGYDINNKYFSLANLNSGSMLGDDIAKDEDGYAYTWLGSGSSDGSTIKATSVDPVTGDPNFPAFYQAARYDERLTAQGITLAPNVGAGKWFLPSFGQLMLLFSNIGFGHQFNRDMSYPKNGGLETQQRIEDTMMNDAIGKVGGSYDGGFLLSSSRVDVNTIYSGGSGSQGVNSLNAMIYYAGGSNRYYYEASAVTAGGIVLPFIIY